MILVRQEQFHDTQKGPPQGESSWGMSSQVLKEWLFPNEEVPHQGVCRNWELLATSISHESWTRLSASEALDLFLFDPISLDSGGSQDAVLEPGV